MTTRHGATDEGVSGVVHQSADVLHLLSAGIWLGALPPLIILLNLADSGGEVEARNASFGLERFSGIGPLVVAVLILTGFANSLFLIGLENFATAFRQPYIWVLVVKLCLFAAMLALAAANRFRLAPALAHAIAQSEAISAPIQRVRRVVPRGLV